MGLDEMYPGGEHRKSTSVIVAGFLGFPISNKKTSLDAPTLTGHADMAG